MNQTLTNINSIPMKKIIVSALLLIGAINAKAALFITNTAPYDVMLTVWAHDVANPSPCSYYCHRFPIAAGGALAIANVNSPGMLWEQPWQIPATLITAGADWDAVDVVPMYSGVPYATIGNPGSCAASTSYSGSGGGYSINASWTAIGGGNVFLNITP